MLGPCYNNFTVLNQARLYKFNATCLLFQREAKTVKTREEREKEDTEGGTQAVTDLAVGVKILITLYLAPIRKMLCKQCLKHQF